MPGAAAPSPLSAVAAALLDDRNVPDAPPRAVERAAAPHAPRAFDAGADVSPASPPASEWLRLVAQAALASNSLELQTLARSFARDGGVGGGEAGGSGAPEAEAATPPQRVAAHAVSFAAAMPLAAASALASGVASHLSGRDPPPRLERSAAASADAASAAAAAVAERAPLPQPPLPPPAPLGAAAAAAAAAAVPLPRRGPAATMALSFVAGGLAGAGAKTVIAPLDRVKILFQVSNTPFTLRGVWAELARTARDEGARGLFRGNAAQVARIYPYSGIQLASFDLYARLLLAARGGGGGSGGGGAGGAPHRTPHHGNAASRLAPVDRVLAGAAAGATSVVATYPLDLIRARLAVHTPPPPPPPHGGGGSALAPPPAPGIVAAVRAMAAEGGAASLYRGLGPTLLGILPYAGISFATYEGLKAAVAPDGAEPSTLARLGCGGAAGLAGQTLTYPLDVVRRRMQTEGFTPRHAHVDADAGAGAPAPARGNGGRFPAERHSMAETFGRIVRTEGVLRGLWKGVTMNLVKGPVSVGLSFTVYDALKKAWAIDGGGGA